MNALRRHLGSVIVIAIAIGIAAYAFFADRDKVTDLERDRRAHLLFPAFRKDDMVSLELWHGTEKLRFEATTDDAGDHEWKMTEPAGLRGDSVAIDRLLGVLEYAAFERKVPSGGTGFGDPRARGILTMKGVTYRFALGGPATPPEGAAYFELDGEGTFVVRSDLVAELTKPADAYRDRSIVPYLSVELSRLDVTGPETWSIARRDDVSFAFVPPSTKYAGRRVSRTMLDRVWTALAEMRADSFPPADAAKAALANPVFTIGMSPSRSDAKPATLVLGGPCPGEPEDVVFEQREPTHVVACVPRGVLDGLGTKLDDLVDHHAFAAIPEETLELSIETVGKGTLEIARKGNGWHERRPVDRDLVGEPGDMATGLVKALTSAEGELLAGPPLSFTPQMIVKLTRAETNVVETVEVAGDIVRRSDGAYVKMPPWFSHRLQIRDADFRGTVVWPVSIDNAHIDALTSTCAGAEQKVTRGPNETFALTVGGKSFSPDGGEIVALGEAIERVRAVAWVGADDGTFGFESGCVVGLNTRGEAGTVQAALRIGAAADGDTFYARTVDDPDVFTVSGAFRSLASPLLVDRSVFYVDPDTVERVEIWNVAANVHVDLPAGADAGQEGETAAAALGGLRAERVVHVGAAKPDEGFLTPTMEVRTTSTGDGGKRTAHFVVGRAAGEDMYYARTYDVDATFLLSKSSLQPLLDALRKRGP